MIEHVFLIPPSRSEGRWREAFGDDITVVRDPRKALDALRATTVAWVDAGRPDWIAGLRQARPELPIVALSLNPDTTEGMRAFESGVRGYCHALAVPEMLRQVATVVSHGGLWLGAELMARAATTLAKLAPPEDRASSPLDVLTARECDVALLVAGGACNKEVARRLNITSRTVKAHLTAIFDKLGVRDRLQLVLKLRHAGVSPPAAARA